jgi:homoserine O-acetyltransferase
MPVFHHPHPFHLENGNVLPSLEIAYHSYGQLNEKGDNVVWVCHALTANSDPGEWWRGLVGAGCVIDPAKHFIVCANIPASCYGSSGPLSIHPGTGQPYYADFPMVTIRDMVNAFILLRNNLGIEKISLLIGGSMGGYQVLEWCVMEKAVIERACLLATSAAETAWGIAVHSAQRLAIEADASWKDHDAAAGQRGLKAARAIGLLTYRNYALMIAQQSDPDHEKLDHYKASSYINYQGEKLVKRFNAYSYWLLTKSMDSHHLGRGRGGDLKKILAIISQKTLVMGFKGDILCPVEEQRFLADHIPGAHYAEIESAYGHDGFIVETDLISEEIKKIFGYWI